MKKTVIGNQKKSTTAVKKTARPTNKREKSADPAARRAKRAAKMAAEELKAAAAWGSAVAAAAEAVEADEEWAGMWSGVDDEIAWANCWCPFWEMEAYEDAYNALYEDVLFDFDLWGFKNCQYAPNL
ncbi:ERD (early-responsive to dehydration stress)family protein [Striga asiatica]|uniref:ERD (Early-responsive to dehydration stress)family protein n=1 Tax=Striga asiatica TaxID=4170 RepID=A0A5A7QEY7_STRAF|nr:ERD (early-responsive to dehydration stress)family protein [Striga asiatica]